MSPIIQLGPEETGTVSLYDILNAALDWTAKPKPIDYAGSTATRDIDFRGNPPVPLLECIVPVPRLVEQLRDVIKPQLESILVPTNSQFAAIVHPASITLPFKRLNHLEKDNESQFEQENLAPVFKIMAYHMAYNEVQREIGEEPQYAAVFKRWLSPDFQKNSFHFFASSTLAPKNITDFGLFSCHLPPNWNGQNVPNYSASFDVKAVVEVKTKKVLTERVFGRVTGFYESKDSDEKEYVTGMAIQYVWPDEAPSNISNDAGGAGSTPEQTLDKILRQIWCQLIEEKAEFAVLTNAALSYYFFRRRDNSGDLYISPAYRTADNVMLYAWLSAAFGINGVDSTTITTPPVNKDGWDSLPVFEASGVRPSTLPETQVAHSTGRSVRKRQRRN